MWKVFVAKLEFVTKLQWKPNPTLTPPPTLYVHIVVIAGSAKVLCASFYPCPGCVQCTQTHLAVGYIHFGSCYAHFELVIDT
jgi:hypothetical protein